MDKKGIEISTGLIVILIIIVLGVIAGGYLILSEQKPGDNAITSDELSGLEFEIKIQQENQTSKVTQTMMMDDINSEKLKTRIEIKDENQDKILQKQILNTELEKGWFYYEETPGSASIEPKTWYILPDSQYLGGAKQLSGLRDNLLASIPEGWTGEEFTMSIETTNRLGQPQEIEYKITPIEINPDFDEELFEVEDYQSPAAFQGIATITDNGNVSFQVIQMQPSEIEGNTEIRVMQDNTEIGRTTVKNLSGNVGVTIEIENETEVTKGNIVQIRYENKWYDAAEVGAEGF